MRAEARTPFRPVATPAGALSAQLSRPRPTSGTSTIRRSRRSIGENSRKRGCACGRQAQATRRQFLGGRSPSQSLSPSTANRFLVALEPRTGRLTRLEDKKCNKLLTIRECCSYYVLIRSLTENTPHVRLPRKPVGEALASAD